MGNSPVHLNYFESTPKMKSYFLQSLKYIMLSCGKSSLITYQVAIFRSKNGVLKTFQATYFAHTSDIKKEKKTCMILYLKQYLHSTFQFLTPKIAVRKTFKYKMFMV